MEYTSKSEDEVRNQVKAGYKGGPFYKNPILHPSMTIADGVQPEVKQSFWAKATPSMKVEDPWYSRRK